MVRTSARSMASLSPSGSKHQVRLHGVLRLGLSLTDHRFCCSYDCSPYRFIHIQTKVFYWRGRLVSIPLLRVHTLGCVPSLDVIFGFPQQLKFVRVRRDILLLTCSTILVPTCPELDPSIHYLHIHSCYICFYLLLRPA
jgi:hypothetical protein